MFIPDAHIVGILASQAEIAVFWSRFISSINLVTSFLILLVLSVLCYQIFKKKLAILSISKYVSLGAFISSSYIFLASFTALFFNFHLPLLRLALIIELIIFPLFFIFYLAWKSLIPLYVRYCVILIYFISSFLLSTIAMPILFEQIVFDRKLCFGVTCPLTQSPLIFATVKDSYLIENSEINKKLKENPKLLENLSTPKAIKTTPKVKALIKLGTHKVQDSNETVDEYRLILDNFTSPVYVCRGDNCDGEKSGYDVYYGNEGRFYQNINFKSLIIRLYGDRYKIRLYDKVLVDFNKEPIKITPL